MRNAAPVRVRGGRGLGDALYLRPIAERLIQDGVDVTVLSDYTDVFIGSGAQVAPFDRSAGNVIAHYVYAKAFPGTTQWQDVCRSAKVAADLRFDWSVRNTALVERLRDQAQGRPIIVVHGGREPMDRKDGFGLELLPEKFAFDVTLERLRRECFLVQIGKAAQIYPLHVDLDLNGSTTVSDLLDIAWTCDGVVAQCSFAIPLAEVFDKPLLAIWAAKHARSNTKFIRQTTPLKLLSAPRDRFVMDDSPEWALRAAARGLLDMLPVAA